ncbi:MAG: hypothetical protein ABI806_17690 [Candidatus Solibacter sp.]
MYRFLLFVIAALSLCAQPQSHPDAQVAEMKKVAFLEGMWKGDGWLMMGPGKREEFVQTERVEYKLGGLVLEIEGVGRKASGELVHHALATIAVEADLKTCHFRSYDLQGHFVDAPCRLPQAGVFQWSLELPQGQTRYTLRLNAAGQWHEVGEFSRDGKEWRKTFEMTLDKGR